MKKFYHQEKMKLVDNHDYHIYVFELDIPSSYGFNYYVELDETIKQFLEDIPKSKYPTLFQIKGDFDVLEKADPEEKDYFIQAVINIFVSHMILDEQLEREQRLAAPKSLDEFDLSALNKKGIINKKIMFPEFSIEIVDLNEQRVYEVL